MAVDFSRIGELIIKYYNNDLSVSEELELNDWLSLSDDNHRLLERFMDAGYVRQQLQTLRKSDKQAAWAKILETISEPKVIKMPAPVPRRARLRRFVIAASLLGLTTIGLWIWFRTKAPVETGNAIGSRYGNDLPPGSNKAILTLASGSNIILDTAHNGIVSKELNIKVEKTSAGMITYSSVPKNNSVVKPEDVAYNTITIPRGGQFLVKLSDGSKIWLNSQSSLRYPVSFSGKERNVELTGEGYFEVEKNANMPFHVRVNNMDVEVLGTHFNINGYEDESAIKTTLLEGSVRISKGTEFSLLSPGEEARLNKNGNLKIVKEIDTEKAVAWKNGLFQFKSEDIPSIMRQVARWYDVEISYEDNLPDRKFTGKISRNVNASELFKMLEYIGFHFVINGNKISVTR